MKNKDSVLSSYEFSSSRQKELFHELYTNGFLNRGVRLLVIGFKGCTICNYLMASIRSCAPAFGNISIVFVELASVKDIQLLRLKNVNAFPTVLAYKSGKLRLGWEGFAALAPDEIKREMVEDSLRQVAALADEDDDFEAAAPLPSVSPPPSALTRKAKRTPKSQTKSSPKKLSKT